MAWILVAMAMAQASGYSSNLTPSLGTSICMGAALERLEEKKKKNLGSSLLGTYFIPVFPIE